MAEKHVQFILPPGERYVTCLVPILEKRRRQGMRFIEPGDSQNFGAPPISSEEIRQRSIAIWQGYALDECVANLIRAARIFKPIAIYCMQNLYRSSQLYYGSLYQAILSYLGAFRMLRDHIMEAEKMRDSFEDWFGKHPRWNQRRDVLYAVEEKLCSEIGLASSS
jgi:hypothetical protein